MVKIPRNRDPDGIIKRISCFALDMDGTVYLGEKWINGAREFLEKIKASGRRYIFMTNNSSKSAGDYLQKLERMGLIIGRNEIVTSGEATIGFLKDNYPGKSVFLLGNSSLAREFLDAGIRIDNQAPQIVVTAFDTSLDYSKLCAACDFVRGGLPYIATHPDLNCPTETGYIPDIGSIHAFIEASAGRRPDKVIGKPGSVIINAMLNKAGACPAETAVIGDRLYTDIASGVNNGLAGILVLSGETGFNDLNDSDILPDLVFDCVGDIIKFL